MQNIWDSVDMWQFDFWCGHPAPTSSSFWETWVIFLSSAGSFMKTSTNSNIALIILAPCFWGRSWQRQRNRHFKILNKNDFFSSSEKSYFYSNWRWVWIDMDWLLGFWKIDKSNRYLPTLTDSTAKGSRLKWFVKVTPCHFSKCSAFVRSASAIKIHLIEY